MTAMKMNHINLPVADVPATRDFLVAYGGMEVVHEAGKNFIAILHDAGEMVLNLSHFDKQETGEVDYHPDFHVGFYLGSREEVDALRDRMLADGLDVEAQKARRGRYGFYHRAPGGFLVEFARLELDAVGRAG